MNFGITNNLKTAFGAVFVGFRSMVQPINQDNIYEYDGPIDERESREEQMESEDKQQCEIINIKELQDMACIEFLHYDIIGGNKSSDRSDNSVQQQLKIEDQMQKNRNDYSVKPKKMSYFNFRPENLSEEQLNKNSSSSSYCDIQEEFQRMKKELQKMHQQIDIQKNVNDIQQQNIEKFQLEINKQTTFRDHWKQIAHSQQQQIQDTKKQNEEEEQMLEKLKNFQKENEDLQEELKMHEEFHSRLQNQITNQQEEIEESINKANNAIFDDQSTSGYESYRDNKFSIREIYSEDNLVCHSADIIREGPNNKGLKIKSLSMPKLPIIQEEQDHQEIQNLINQQVGCQLNDEDRDLLIERFGPESNFELSTQKKMEKQFFNLLILSSLLRQKEFCANVPLYLKAVDCDKLMLKASCDQDIKFFEYPQWIDQQVRLIFQRPDLIKAAQEAQEQMQDIHSDVFKMIEIVDNDQSDFYDSEVSLIV